LTIDKSEKAKSVLFGRAKDKSTIKVVSAFDLIFE